MIEINGKIDTNDLKRVQEKFKDSDIVSAQPCPLEEKGNDVYKINPHVTKFGLKNGQYISVFHVKPIYYEALDGTWRPLSEVTHGFGNHWIDFRGDWHTKMTTRYMDWLLKRVKLLKSDGKITVSQPTPYGYPITVDQEELTYGNLS